MNASHPNPPAAPAPADGAALRPLSICVDDLGLHPGVTGSVLQLAELGHISATSAMTQMGHWPEAAQALAPVRGQLDVGLHFNLTESSPEGPGMPLGGLIRRSVLRQLDVAQLASSFESQLAAFASVWGSLPDHVDGHQHVHQFPQVRQAMWQVLDRWRDRHPGWKPWLRASVPALPAGLKGQVLAALGGLVGIVLATVASLGLAQVMGVPYLFNPAVNLLSFVFSAGIGVVFGYFPARRAAHMDPIDALRHE